MTIITKEGFDNDVGKKHVENDSVLFENLLVNVYSMAS